MGKKFLILIGSILVSFAAGAIGTLATTPNITSWYAYLDKPPFLPPNWVFAPVWTLLYLAMGVALYYIITTKTKLSKQRSYQLFGGQLTANTLWSLVFFGAHQAWPGAVIIVTLLITLIVMAYEFKKISRVAAYLILPYIAWVCFASYLNIGVALLN